MNVVDGVVHTFQDGVDQFFALDGLAAAGDQCLRTQIT